MTELASWGVETGWFDTQGVRREAGPSTLDAIARALGYQNSNPPGTGDENPVWVVSAQEIVSARGQWDLVLEDGATLSGADYLPPDLPLGYHKLRLEQAREVLLIISPGRCHLPKDLRSWLWAVQLYALRSQDSWGIGDLGDLRRLGQWSRSVGAGMVQINPLHAPLPISPQQDSPYSPSSRVWRSPLYLRVQDVPGASELGETIGAAACAGAELSKKRLVDRDAVWAIKSDVLEKIYEVSGRDPKFSAWRHQQGESLQRYATFCALTERYGRPWSSWPVTLQRCTSQEVKNFADEYEARVRYHAWLQWSIELQLDDAASTVPLLLDLAVGTDPDGADAWTWPECFASGARIGAPPDDFNMQGQDWGLLPFHPWKLRQAGFEPFVQALRANLRFGGGLRIDHVMGLWRQWWVPLGATSAEGAYVRYPAQELLDILALESCRSQALIVGEDLGTVEDGVAEELEARNILSSKVALFEPNPPAAWPARALASFSTHDLPTLGGVLTGRDVQAQKEAGLQPDDQAAESIRLKVASWSGTSDPSQAASVLGRSIGASPCALVAMSLEDAVGVSERPNMPGTTDQWPNWRLALPEPLEDVFESDAVVSLANALTSARHGQEPLGP